LALKTDGKTVVKFMKDAWRLPTPDLIISITGGAKYADISARLKKAFQMGLVSAATTTSKFALILIIYLFNDIFINRSMDNHSWYECWCCQRSRRSFEYIPI